ncbi:unnamed protein product [Miscanthus lutarioriparius]|uniref:Uncharacterized protein n=1 Tax=Miscanthus lutarioriparius TaxID=422564 RepID=A0A811QZA6_9POAL|nr:unnamed protein product [Miscanthus lutarioriparius]
MASAVADAETLPRPPENQPARGRADHAEPAGVAGHRMDGLCAAAGAGGARGRGAWGRPLCLLQREYVTDPVDAALMAVEAGAKIYMLVLDCTENMNDDRERLRPESWLGEAGRCRKSAFHQRNKASSHKSVREG